MKIRRYLSAARVLATAAAVLSLGACATKRDVRDLHEQLRDLAVRQDSLIMELRAQARVTQDTLRGQSGQIVDLRGEILHRLQDLSETLSQVQALVGENQRGIAGVRDQLANLRRSPGSGGAETPDSGMVAGGGTAAGAVTGGSDAQAMYNAAVQQFQAGHLSTAEVAFKSFLDSYPNDTLAPEAHYYLGDILVQQEHPQEALAEFQKITTNFPAASKTPDAWYRIARLQLQMKRTREAKATLQRIVNSYPGTDAAKLAKADLDSIG
jgi:tol-pal system protein YbgF